MKGVVKLIKLLILLSFILAGVLFCIHNQAEVNLKVFSFSHVNMPLYLMIIGAFFSGVVLTSLYGLFEFLTMSNRIRILQKKLNKNDKELQYLRTLPLDNHDLDDIGGEPRPFGQEHQGDSQKMMAIDK